MLSDVVRDLFERHGDHPAVRAGGLPAPHAVSGIHVSHRWLGRLVLLLFRPRDRAPWLVVKIDRYARYAPRLAREAANLRAIRDLPDFRDLVPQPVGPLGLAGATAFVQTGLAGSPLTAVLRRRLLQREPSWADDHERALRWLDRLARWEPSSDVGVLDPAEGLEELATAVDHGDAAVRRWLDRERARADEVGPVPVPKVRTHGDLGPSNLLLHRSATHLVDWEGDLEYRSPLPEALVLLHHYVRAVPLPSGGMPDRLRAIERAFATDEALGRLTRRSWDRILAARGIDPSLADSVLLAVLGQLAAGTAGTAHAARGRRMWRHSVRHLVARLARGHHRWPPPR